MSLCISHVDPIDAICDALDTPSSVPVDFLLPQEPLTLLVPYKASWSPSIGLVMA